MKALLLTPALLAGSVVLAQSPVAPAAAETPAPAATKANQLSMEELDRFKAEEIHGEALAITRSLKDRLGEAELLAMFTT